MATEQELQLEYEYAQAKAKAEAEQNSAMEQEINARGPMNASGSPDDRQVISDEENANNYQSGIENIPHNTYLEARGLAKGVAHTGVGLARTAQAVGSTIGFGLGNVYDYAANHSGGYLTPRSEETIAAGHRNADESQKEMASWDEAIGGAKGTPEKIMMPIGQIGANIAFAGGAGAAVKNAIVPAVGKVAGYLGGALAGGAVAASSMPDQEGLIVRSDGPVGFKINPDDDAATQQTKKFMNQSLDNMALGIVGDGAFALGKKGVEVVNNIRKSIFTNWNNLPAMKQQAAEDVLSVYGQLGEHPTAEQQRQAAQEVVDLIDQHGEKAYDFGEGVGTKTVKQDTISTINSGLDETNPEQLSVKTKMEALRSSAKRGNAPKTAVQLQEPERVLNEGLQEAQAARGGKAAIDQTRQALQERAQVAAASEDVPAQMAKNNLVKQSSDYTDVLRNDPTFSPIIKQAEDSGIKLDINKLENSKKSEIVQAVKDIRSADASVRNAAYDKISETGVPYGPKLWGDAVEKAKDYIPSNIESLIEKSDGTFGYLNNEIRPRLSETISAARKAGDYETASALQELRDNITKSQIDYIKKKAGGSATARLVDEATAENIRYSEKYNQGIGRELKQNEKTFSPKTMPIDFEEKGRQIVDNAIGNPNRDKSIGQLKEILGPEKEGLVADTALVKATKDIQAGKGADFDKITDDLQKMGHNFGPEQQARLEGFLNDVKNKKMSLDDLEKEIPELEKASTIAKDKIFNDDFPTLFENVSGKQVPKGRGYEVFEDAMNAKQPRVIEKLVEQASKNPRDLEGLKTAWLKSAEGKISSNPKSIGELSENFVENGKKIFGDDSPEVKAVTGLRNEVEKLQQSLNRPGMEGLSATENQSKFRSAIAFLSTFAFGVLNPTAARVNKITSNLAESYNSTTKAHEAIDTILSDNKEMRDAMVNLINKSRNQLSPAQWKQLYAAGARIGLYNLRSSKPLNIQTDTAISK